jgi:hypothetical protein
MRLYKKFRGFPWSFRVFPSLYRVGSIVVFRWLDRAWTFYAPRSRKITIRQWPPIEGPTLRDLDTLIVEWWGMKK